MNERKKYFLRRRVDKTKSIGHIFIKPMRKKFFPGKNGYIKKIAMQKIT